MRREITMMTVCPMLVIIIILTLDIIVQVFVLVDDTAHVRWLLISGKLDRDLQSRRAGRRSRHWATGRGEMDGEEI
jgi:hypothetical protein